MAKLIEITGKALSGEWGVDDVDGTGIPVLRTTNFTNVGVINYDNVVTRIITKKDIEEKYLKQGDIIIEKSGGSDKQPVGRVVFFEGIEHQYLFNNFTGLLRIREKEKWEPKYVFYSLYANYKNGGTKVFENKTTGLHNLKTDDYVSRFEVKDRTIEEQKSICEKLGMICEIIKLQEEQLINLDNLIKSRFVEMFGEYPANPRRWKVGTIKEVVADVRYGSSRPAVDGGKYPYLRMNNITYSGELDLTDIKRINVPESELEKCTVRRGDVLFNRTNSKELVGKTCVYNQDEMMVLAGFVIRVRVNERVLPDFLSTFLNTDFSKKMLSGMCKAAIGQANINAREMQNIGIYIPPVELQRQFVQFKEQTTKLKLEIQKSLDETQTLMDALMQEYFG